MSKMAALSAMAGRAQGAMGTAGGAVAGKMDAAGTAAVMDVFAFPTIEEQLSDAWMGKFVGEYLASSAAKLEASGKIKALSDYNALINSSYLAAAGKM